MRAVNKRTDGSMSIRDWVLWAVHTPWAKLVSHPIFAAINFAGSLVIFYFTPLFEWSVRDHLAISG
jgi:cytochrome c oxidase assembly factor CtaG